MSKRLFDLIGAALGLVLLSPLLLIIAVWIKLDSPGPALFRQQRVGRYGRPFTIHKFRTMVVDAAARGPALTAGADPRITPSGVFLRRSKLDELPQLWDVLAGNMSLVGPRPELPVYVAHYPPGLRETVLAVRPGITDPVSLQLADESEKLARAADPEYEYIHVLLPMKLRIAAAYAQDATLASDLWIIFRSFRLLLARLFIR